jgi:hypothetical protein
MIASAGNRMLGRTRVRIATTGMKALLTMKLIRLAITSRMKNEYISSGWVAKVVGPGAMPCCIMPVANSAAVTEPGMPKAKSGMKVAPTVAEFAASDATRPWIEPLPKFLRSVAVRLAMA